MKLFSYICLILSFLIISFANCETYMGRIEIHVIKAQYSQITDDVYYYGDQNHSIETIYIIEITFDRTIDNIQNYLDEDKLKFYEYCSVNSNKNSIIGSKSNSFIIRLQNP